MELLYAHDGGCFFVFLFFPILPINPQDDAKLTFQQVKKKQNMRITTSHSPINVNAHNLNLDGNGLETELSWAVGEAVGGGGHGAAGGVEGGGVKGGGWSC